MKAFTEEIINFLDSQGFVIASSIDPKGNPHSSCKGIVKIDKRGLIYLLDLYKGRTYKNIKSNPHMSITAVDEHKFIGYCIKGKAQIIERERLNAEIIKVWEVRISNRITSRIIKNIQGHSGHGRQPESLLPKPKYLIVMRVRGIVDLTPYHMK